ncbi:spore cortex-lytic enzyme [Salmonella phage SSBI34]|nr:spore cortex-lytic enzyme [Salmonella phage SSBI34]
MKKRITAILLACTLSLSTAPALAKESAPKKLPVVHICKKNDNAVNALACNMFKEASGEGERGMLAVGFVTLNRKDKEKYPDSVKGVVYQSSQFSWANSGKNYRIRDKVTWEKAKKLSKFILALHKYPTVYSSYDFTNGSTHYHTKKIRPYWIKSMIKTVIIGNHMFYKEKEKI